MDNQITELECLIEALETSDKAALALALALIIELDAEQRKLKMKIEQLEK